MSAFLAADEAEIDALCETKLQQWATVVVFQRTALERSGVQVVPSFRTPHVTLAHPDLAELVRSLIGCEHDVIINPYHEPEVGPLEAP